MNDATFCASFVCHFAVELCASFFFSEVQEF